MPTEINMSAFYYQVCVIFSVGIKDAKEPYNVEIITDIYQNDDSRLTKFLMDNTWTNPFLIGKESELEIMDGKVFKVMSHFSFSSNVLWCLNTDCICSTAVWSYLFLFYLDHCHGGWGVNWRFSSLNIFTLVRWLKTSLLRWAYLHWWNLCAERCVYVCASSFLK